jgi:hypothetical protein
MYRIPELMSASVRLLSEFAACGGRTAVVQVEATEGGSVELGLASLLAELDAAGDPVRAVELRQSDRGAAEAVAVAIGWLAAHGRRPIVRAAAPLGRAGVAAARRHGATVILEIAHFDAAVQKVLLGDGAESSATLLLHAQHLRACEIEVAVQVGPLLPAIHDDRTVAKLVHHIVAADLVDAHLTIGRLTTSRLHGLASVLPWPQVATMARSFGIDPSAEDAVPFDGVVLPAMPRLALLRAVERTAISSGLRLDHCGCPAQCHLDPESRPAFVPLTTDLFNRAG